MNQLTMCQPGWLAVFEDTTEPEGCFTEPVACWVIYDDSDDDGQYGAIVHPVCALGGDVCDAALAANYLGVLAPGRDVAKFMSDYRAVTGRANDTGGDDTSQLAS